MRSFVADGNFKADHLKQKNDDDDVWLTNGEAFMTNIGCYNQHLAQAQETKTASLHSTFLSLHFSFFHCRDPHVTVIGRS